MTARPPTRAAIALLLMALLAGCWTPAPALDTDIAPAGGDLDEHG